MKNLYNLLVGFLLLTAGVQLSAQNWGYAQIGYYLEDIAVAPDGNIWVCSFSGDDPDWLDVTSNYIMKLNSDGVKQWGLTPAGLPATYAWAKSAMPQADGGAIIYCAVDGLTPSLYKVDSDGNLLWETSALWTGVSYFYGGIGVQLTDGRIVIGGLGDFEHQFYETDNSGNLLSTFTMAPDTTGGWGWGYWNFKETGMVATPDGGFAYATGNDSYKILYKYDSGLNLEWSAYYDWIVDWEYGYQNTLKLTSDGGYLLSGSGSTAAGTYYGTLRKIDADGNLEWAQSYNHGADWEEGALAVEHGDGYIIWTQDAGENSTNGWVIDADGNETGSLFIPIINCSWGFSETGLEVWDAEKTADGGYILGGRQFIEDCNQRTTIIKSNPDGSFDPCIFNCVWPGDANNDGYADASDLFEIGINYGATGFTRDDMSIDWTPKLSRAWMEPDTLFWYIFNDLKWTDCNGDGVINDDDTTAVSNNFGLDHPLNTLKTSSGDVPLYFAPVDPVLHVGLNEIPIMLGDEVNTVDEIYGISFTIEISGTEDIDANTMKVTFNDSWLSTAETRLSVSKTDSENKLVFTGLVRKDRMNVAGNGEIGTFSVVVIDNITGKTDADEATLSFVEATAIKLNRDEISLETGSVTFPIEISEGVDNALANGIHIYPNPASETVYIDNLSSNTIEQIEITDLTGKILLTTDLKNSNQIDLTNLESGNYIIKIKCSDKILIEKLSIF